MIYIPLFHLGDPDVNFAGLIVLNAKNMRELGRAEFCLDGPAPKPLHGCFSAYKGNILILSIALFQCVSFIKYNFI